MGKILYGKQIAESIRQSIRKSIAELAGSHRRPGLEIVIAGNDEASIYYARLIEKAGERDGIRTSLTHMADATTPEVVERIGKLNDDAETDGIIVQLPLPEGVEKEAVFEKLSPLKDADGQTPLNLGLLLSGRETTAPATARAVIKLLAGHSIDPAGKRAVVVGRSTAVGLPAALLLTRLNATVTLCHSKSIPLEKYTSQADILVVSAGVPELIGPGHVKPGAAVIDVGTNEVEGNIVGDVQFSEILEKGDVSPVPGGLGAVTLACLFENVFRLYRQNILGIGN